MSEPPVGPWRMCAVRLSDGLLHDVGDRRTIEFCGRSEGILDVDVALVADDEPSATHWGWIETGDTEPCMIYPVKGMFTMCFPYGPQIEVEHGKGRVVRLAVTQVLADIAAGEPGTCAPGAGSAPEPTGGPEVPDA